MVGPIQLGNATAANDNSLRPGFLSLTETHIHLLTFHIKTRQDLRLFIAIGYT